MDIELLEIGLEPMINFNRQLTMCRMYQNRKAAL